MSKIVKFDSDQLSNYKWKKCVLGVIHPEHTSVKKIDEKDTFSDLVVTSKPAQFNCKPSYVPPASVVVKRETNPNRRPKSAKPGTDIVDEAFKSIPQARPQRKNFMRTSLIAGKDLKNSLTNFKAHVGQKKAEITQKKNNKARYIAENQQIDKLLSEKFKSAKISEQEYSEIKYELYKVSQDYEAQLAKQKIIINFLTLKETNLDMQEINRMLADFQLKKEKQLIVLQHFVLRLKEITVSISKSFQAYVKMEHISRTLGEFSMENNESRDILVDFLEKVKIQLRKDGIADDNDDAIPFGVLEKTITNIFVKWEREKTILEGFVNDIFAVFCEEFNLSKEAVINSRPKNKRELELKVVAEFINMYLERLHQSIESKIRSLEKLKNTIENGRLTPGSWTDALLNFLNLSGKPEKKIIKSESAQAIPNKSQADRKTPPKKSPGRKQSPAKPNDKKSNVGRNARKFASGKLSSIPEERKKSPVALSKKNPLDSVTSLDEGLDDIISDLNPIKSQKGPNKKDKAGPFSNENSKNFQRKGEMDSTEGLFNFRLQKVRDSKEIFSSVDAPLMRSIEPIPADSVFQSIADIEAVRFPKKYPESRSEFIKSGMKPFYPYMDKDGTTFDPKERYPNIKADDLDPLDPYFLENIGNQSPNPTTDWFIRSHHLRSFTNHPYSVNDNPNYYKAKMQSEVQENITGFKKDERDDAIAYLEKSLEDLKCEIESRRRVAVVNNFETENRMSGHMIKAITPIAQGLNIKEREGLVLHTYESILEELRSRERAILNEKRAETYEKNRPPQAKWYELKSNDFTDEIHRHNSSLKPREEHQKLLTNLAVTDLY